MSRFRNTISLLSILIILVINSAAQTPQPREINGGILNGKAKKLPSPEYPEEAKAAGLTGIVRMNVLIDEDGNVISADLVTEPFLGYEPGGDGKPTTIVPEPVSPILVDSARAAVLEAKFAPTFLNGLPVRIRGIIVYWFFPQRPIVMRGPLLNGKATSLPRPKYPEAAKSVNAKGAVNVRVMVDETGNVSSAKAVSGHPLLRSAAESAAREAKFNPTTLSGVPVKVSGVLAYNFQLPDDSDQ